MSKNKILQQQPAQPVEDDNNDDDGEIELKEQPTTAVKKGKPVLDYQYVEPARPKAKRNLTEEHKQVLRDRLLLAHAKKRENVEARRKLKEEAENQYNEEKARKILAEADKLKKKRSVELDKIEIKKPVTVPVPVPVIKKKKQPVIMYVEDSSDEEEEEEEPQIIIKQKRKSSIKKQVVATPAPVVPSAPVYQQVEKSKIVWC